MPEIGQTLSHYRIEKKIGQGGMGEVYLADDTTLDRKVALKFLPEAFTSDPERMARFEREAKLLASLNHSNIAGIYGLEQAERVRFLVLEYVKGETLQARLRKGALLLEDALALCRQIAEGLEAAHEKGVVHRDLKPANMMITAEEKIKILDFGLAKALADETQGIDSSQSPTLTEAMTRPGVILGTAAYMSPEQAKGKSVDKRADIWAFGCILYECLTGKKAFEGETVTETLAAILRGEPGWNILPTTTPQSIRFVLRRCLEKEKSRRLQSAADMQILLEQTQDVGELAAPVNQLFPWLWKSIAIVFVIAFVAVSFVHFREKPPTLPETVEMQIRVTDNINVDQSTMSLSPNGRHLAFVAPGPNSYPIIWIRGLNSLESRPLLDTESKSGIYLVCWSPDSRYIAFKADDKIQKIDITSGLTKTICGFSGWISGGSWNHDDEIILGVVTEGIMHVPATGGELSPLTIPNPKESIHIEPTFLTDGRHFLYACSFTPGNNGIYIGSLDSKPEEYDPKLVLADNFTFKYVSIKNSGTGHLLYLLDNTLMAQLFDEKSLEIVGEPFPVAEQVASGGFFDIGLFTVSTNGILVYQDMRSQVDPDIGKELIWVNREGKEIRSIGPPGEYSNFRLSWNDKKIIFDREDNNGEPDIWIHDLERDVSSRLTSDPAPENIPVSSPDGLQVLFSSNRNGFCGLYLTAASGTEEEELLIKMGSFCWGTDWSKNGRYILYLFGSSNTGTDIWVAPLFDDQEPYPYLNTQFNEGSATFSPDVKWVAYVSNETGRDEIYVQSFPRSGFKKQISSNGGSEPYWSENGTELFYVADDRNLMATSIQLNPTFEPGISKPLFPVFPAPGYESQHCYAVSRDGQQFLILKPPEDESTRTVTATVVVNWEGGLKI